jgi:hypothetical protein
LECLRDARAAVCHVQSHLVAVGMGRRGEPQVARRRGLQQGMVGVGQVSLSRFMVIYCVSLERRHHRWPVYGSPTCRRVPQNS